MSNLATLEKEFNELKAIVEKLESQLLEKRERFDQLKEIMSYVQEARDEVLTTAKEAMDTLYCSHEGGKATDGDFLTAYEKLGIECDLISEDVADDDPTVQTLHQEAGAG